MRTLTLAAATALAALAFMPGAAHGAESYDSCTGFIDSLPAVIGTQGTWCLRQDLSTAISSGSAIWIGANNVTVNCNGFKIGGLAAGPLSEAYGIQSSNAANSVVRNCNIRGFESGIWLSGMSAVIEDNRLEGIYYTGIRATNSFALIQRNVLTDIGSTNGSAVGIHFNGKAVGNSIYGMSTYSGGSALNAIFVGSSGGVVQDNFIAGLMLYDTAAQEGNAVAILAPYSSAQTHIIGNKIMQSAAAVLAVKGYPGGARVACLDNVASLAAVPAFLHCSVDERNQTLP